MASISALKAAILDETTGLTSILRNAKVLAYELDDDSFKKWVDSEISGYTGGTEVPNYRKARPENRGNFTGMFGAQVKNFQLATSQLPDIVKEFAQEDSIRQKIAVIEDLLDTEESEFGSNWPQEYVNHVSDKFLVDMRMISAVRAVPRSTFVNIVDSVRTQLLTFILELERKYPQLTEEEVANVEIPSADVQTIVNQYIYGDGNAIAAGETVTQTTTITVNKNDADSLLEFLKTNGIENEDATNLVTAVVEDGTRTQDQGFGTRVVSAITELGKNAISGGWSVTKSTVATIATKAIAAYYGWPV